MATERVSGHVCLGGLGLLFRATAARTHARPRTLAHMLEHTYALTRTCWNHCSKYIKHKNKYLLLNAHTHNEHTLYAAPLRHPLSAGFSPGLFSCLPLLQTSAWDFPVKSWNVFTNCSSPLQKALQYLQHVHHQRWPCSLGLKHEYFQQPDMFHCSVASSVWGKLSPYTEYSMIILYYDPLDS